MKVAEEKKTTEKATEKKSAEKKEQPKPKKIVCEGPKNQKNGATYLRVGKTSIFPGEELTVGKDVTEADAKLLKNHPTWNFKEVK